MVIPLALFRIIPFAPFRIGGKLVVGLLPGELAVGQVLPRFSVVFALLFVLCVPFRVSAFFSEPFAHILLYPSAIFRVRIAFGVTPGGVSALSFLCSVCLRFTRHRPLTCARGWQSPPPARRGARAAPARCQGSLQAPPGAQGREQALRAFLPKHGGAR